MGIDQGIFITETGRIFIEDSGYVFLLKSPDDNFDLIPQLSAELKFNFSDTSKYNKTTEDHFYDLVETLGQQNVKYPASEKYKELVLLLQYYPQFQKNNYWIYGIIGGLAGIAGVLLFMGKK